MDDLERMIQEAEKFNRQDLDKKRLQLEREVNDYEFKSLLDAVELLIELKAKREKKQKDMELIRIIEKVLSDEPFEYPDEDFILITYKDYFDNNKKLPKRK